MRLAWLSSLGLLISSAVFGQNLIVTAQAHGGSAMQLDRDDITAEVNQRYAAVHDLIPQRGAPLRLYIAIDDSARVYLGPQLADLRSFIEEQPATTSIGIAYLRDGEAIIATPPGNDRRVTDRALRLPVRSRGVLASPYMEISDLIGKWHNSDAARREILYIGSGIDPNAGDNPVMYPPLREDSLNLYLQDAIADAQRAGIPVFSISVPGDGERYLSDLAEDTGGEAFSMGPAGSPTLNSSLKSFAGCLDDQYLLVVDANARKGFNPVHVLSERSDVSLIAATKIYFSKSNRG